MPKACALAGIPDGLVQRAARDAGRGGGHGRAALVEDLHADHEAVALVAEQVLDRHLDVLEEDLARLGGMLAHLLQRLAGADAGPVTLHDEAAHALVTIAGLVLAKTVKYEATGPSVIQVFVAIEDVMVAPADGGGLDAGDVGACVGLGHAVGDDLAVFGQLGEVARLLLLVGSNQHGQRRQLVEHERRLDAGAAVGELLAHDALFKHSRANAAVFLRDIEVDQARLACLVAKSPTASRPFCRNARHEE